jgi:peroxiredoxin 2/4
MRPQLNIAEVSAPRIGHQAPSFQENSTQGFIKLSDYRGRWLILFSYPADFTPVCTSEVKAFAGLYPLLKELNCELVGISVDSVKEHLNWIQCLQDAGSEPIQFPIIADLNLDISYKYGLLPNENAEEASRSLYVIDPNQVVRAIIHYPASTGRNTDEVLRLLKALQIADAQQVITPVNWQPGDALIQPAVFRTKKSL